VSHGLQGFVVNLVLRTCTCRGWDLTGIPCRHALAVMREERLKVEDYVDDFYSLEKYKKAYAETINPINGQNMWVKTSGDQIHAPSFKDTQKNLALKRRLEEGEKRDKQARSYGKVSTKGHKKTCSQCKQVGHTKRACNFAVFNTSFP